MNKNTPCKKCVFAEYEGDTQKDCQFRILDKYQELGVELIGAYDEEKEFFVIKDRICPYARGEQWLRDYGDDIDGQLEKELQYKYNIVFFLDKDTDLEELLLGVEKINNSSICKPKLITLIRAKHTKIKPSEIEERLNAMNIAAWKISNVMQDVPREKLIDDIVKLDKKNSVHVFVFDYSNIPDNLLDKINNYSIKELNLFGIIDSENLVATMRSEYLRVYYLDDPTITVIDKMRQEPELYRLVPLEEILK